jgi:anti-sigma regulatory factor (Ser/Thr protein kinase)
MLAHTHSESYPATAESVPRARAAVTEFAEKVGVRGERLDAIRLAASEAITNAVVHAYRQGGRGSIQINASYVEGDVWLLIADSGRGLRPSAKSPGLGLGLALIAQLVDDFQILSRATGGTELRMRFHVHSREPRQEGQRVQLTGSRAQLRGSFCSAVAPA